MIDYSFQYIVPLENMDDYSSNFFQGFTQNILEVSPIVGNILKYPQLASDLFFVKPTVLFGRMSGLAGYSILPLEKRYLANYDFDMSRPFICIFSSNANIAEVTTFINRSPMPILHISTDSTEHGTFIEIVNHKVFFEFIKQVISKLESSGLSTEIELLTQVLNKPIKWETESASIKQRTHLTTIPNEFVLKTAKFILGELEYISPADENNYIDAITDSIDAIVKLRLVIADNYDPIAPLINDLIISLPALLRSGYKKPPTSYDLRSIKQGDTIAKVFRLFRDQKQYRFESDGSELFKFLDSTVATSLISYRTDELRAFTAATTVKACSNFCPALRLPPVMNTFHSLLGTIAGISRGNSPRRKEKEAKAYSKISETLTTAVPDKFLEIIDYPVNRTIKLICDAPLEWININGLPLMLRYFTSRIPATPGNLFYQQAISSRQFNLPLNSFREILVVRAFPPKDPLKNVLKPP